MPGCRTEGAAGRGLRCTAQCRGMIMADLKIRIFKNGKPQPETTITVPGRVLPIAAKLVPKRAAAALQEKGIDLNEIIQLSTQAEINGTLVEIEEHRKNEKIVISLEQRA
jgi:hypothetical protein